MAGERKGKAYEAVIYDILLTVLQQNPRLLSLSVFWNETPSLLSIEPDFIIGPTVEEPICAVLVTHTADKKKFEKKFWRSMGEVAELRGSYDPVPVIVDVLFGDQAKKGLQTALIAAVDIPIHVDGLGLSALLDGGASKLLKHRPKSKSGWLDAVRTLRRGDSVFDGAVDSLRLKISDGIMQHTSARPLTASPSATLRSGIRQCKTTSVRNGLAQLALLTPTVCEQTIKAIQENKRLAEVPGYVHGLEIYKRSIGGWLPSPDVSSAVRILSPEKTRSVLGRIPESMLAIVQDVYSIDQFEIFAEAIADNYNLCTCHNSMKMSSLGLD